MVLHIKDHEITSDTSVHTAWRVGKTWRVSWARGRTFSKNEAITAMTIAEYVEAGPMDEVTAVRVRAWLSEVGLSESDLPGRGDRG